MRQILKSSFILLFSAFFLFSVSGNDGTEAPQVLNKVNIEQNEQLLENVLTGSAEYCAKLKNSAFHFFCSEKIVTVLDEIESAGYGSPRVNRKRSSKRYEFDYQLINDSSGVNEQRKDLSGKIKGNYDIHDLVISFLSERPVFAPLMLMGKEGQADFDFLFVEMITKGEREYIRVKAVPKVEKKYFFKNALIDIDKKDFSVRKIKVIPRYINGFESLMRRTFFYRTRLFLESTISFDQEYKGLWFPTRISISETYKGGAFVTRNMGMKGWERSRTEFMYTDYRFFNVDMDIKN